MASRDPSSSTIIFPIVKVVVAGDAGVGKTSLIRRYCTNEFEETHAATGGVDFQIKIVEIENRSIKLSIWDIAGQEKFGAFRDTFYRGAKAVALVYDVTEPGSMENLPRWHAEIAQICPAAHFVIVGNKTDLERKTSRELVEAWANSMGFPHFETSALTGDNVNQFFTTLAKLATLKKSR
jgi:small GTP-binding protein